MTGGGGVQPEGTQGPDSMGAREEEEEAGRRRGWEQGRKGRGGMLRLRIQGTVPDSCRARGRRLESLG